MSELFSPASPNRWILSALYASFAVLLSLFGFGLLRFVQDVGKYQKTGITAAVVFSSVGLLHVLSATMLPQDAWGSAPTLPGKLHIILHGFITILSLLYMVLFGLWFHRTGIARFFKVYSIATMIAAVIAAGWFMTSYGGPNMGISERIGAAVGFQWTIIVAALVLKQDRAQAIGLA